MGYPLNLHLHTHETCDARDPARFGFALDRGLALARRCGLYRLYTFERGRPVPVPLEDSC